MKKELLAVQKAIELVKDTVRDGVTTGFNCHEGDWAERLFKSQHNTSEAVKILESLPQEQSNSEWFSVSDRLPETDERILLLIEMPNYEMRIPETGYYLLRHGHTYIDIDGNTRKPFCRADGDDDTLYSKDDDEYFFVTHWQPLPQPPKAVKVTVEPVISLPSCDISLLPSVSPIN